MDRSIVLPQTFSSPRRFNPAWSLLGRRLRRRTGDARRAEALFIVAVGLLALVLLLVQFAGWAAIQPLLLGDAARRVTFGFWTAQVALALVFACTCVVGFKPALHVAVSHRALHLRQGDAECHMAVGDVSEISTIPSKLFHQHYRRYAATQAFFTHLGQEVLLLATREGPVVIGLPEGDLSLLRDVIEAARAEKQAPAPHLV